MRPRIGAIGRTIGLSVVVTCLSAGVLSADGDLDAHPPVQDAADLSREEAIDYYEGMVDRMERRYAISQDPTAMNYRRWYLYNDAPYRSATHGNRYVNSYANGIARRAGYGHLQPGESLPPGSILAKDSFSVTTIRERLPGALFIMEKLKAGVSPDTGDWRYAMIMPDGSYFGDTSGIAPENVEFCTGCHAQRADTDHVFFVPDDARLPMGR